MASGGLDILYGVDFLMPPSLLFPATPASEVSDVRSFFDCQIKWCNPSPACGLKSNCSKVDSLPTFCNQHYKHQTGHWYFPCLSALHTVSPSWLVYWRMNWVETAGPVHWCASNPSQSHSYWNRCWGWHSSWRRFTTTPLWMTHLPRWGQPPFWMLKTQSECNYQV